MAIILSSPVTGSIKVFNSSASPQSMYLCNLQTATVSGDPNNQQQVFITNMEQSIIFEAKISNISTIGASTMSFNLQQAVDVIAGLIMK